MAPGSSTVDKALTLLSFFSEQRPFVGLSELSRLSGFNKATTLRLLASLEAKGFVEQSPETKEYHLGPAVLRYAQVREASFPLKNAVQSILEQLVERTGETAHASVIAGDSLANIGQVESRRSNRVIIDPGEALPFHATASGIAFLAFAKPEIVEAAVARGLTAHTAYTITDPEKLRERIRQARADGFARSSESYEEEVVGFAAPHFGPSGEVSGAVAVALPKARATAEAELTVVAEIRDAARRLTASRGGFHPANYPEPNMNERQAMPATED
jgi:IclR family acetate operon transcriptional repressor